MAIAENLLLFTFYLWVKECHQFILSDSRGVQTLYNNSDAATLLLPFGILTRGGEKVLFVYMEPKFTVGSKSPDTLKKAIKHKGTDPSTGRSYGLSECTPFQQTVSQGQSCSTLLTTDGE